MYNNKICINKTKQSLTDDINSIPITIAVMRLHQIKSKKM